MSHRYPADVIAHCVWLSFRFPLGYREVEERNGGVIPARSPRPRRPGSSRCSARKSSWTWPPAEIYAVLLDRGVCLCSESTMYRIPRRHGEVRERRRQAARPPRKKPALVARYGQLTIHSGMAMHTPFRGPRRMASRLRGRGEEIASLQFLDRYDHAQLLLDEVRSDCGDISRSIPPALHRAQRS
ncbi:transposase [Streptomyces olivochromogenes]|uniref:Transposase n=1 Tax=Streptomyces olivochromogenes TaxID=1963 RepID=A0A250VCQ1_STROL|nr:hypothetical protein [Streptomyces olivochromogenes]GAX51864.1 transposase [Streptomyces olivochromogenes]